MFHFPECVNKNRSCSGWAALGYCEEGNRYRPYMLDNCAKACYGCWMTRFILAIWSDEIKLVTATACFTLWATACNILICGELLLSYLCINKVVPVFNPVWSLMGWIILRFFSEEPVLIKWIGEVTRHGDVEWWPNANKVVLNVVHKQAIIQP